MYVWTVYNLPHEIILVILISHFLALLVLFMKFLGKDLVHIGWRITIRNWRTCLATVVILCLRRRPGETYGRQAQSPWPRRALMESTGQRVVGLSMLFSSPKTERKEVFRTRLFVETHSWSWEGRGRKRSAYKDSWSKYRHGGRLPRRKTVRRSQSGLSHGALSLQMYNPKDAM